MLPTVTLRNVSAACIVVGLLVAVLTLVTTSDRPFVLAGTGLRVEAAVRARVARHDDAGL